MLQISVAYSMINLCASVLDNNQHVSLSIYLAIP